MILVVSEHSLLLFLGGLDLVTNMNEHFLSEK